MGWMSRRWVLAAVAVLGVRCTGPAGRWDACRAVPASDPATERDGFSIDRLPTHGQLVYSVMAGTAAERIGVRRGDILICYGGRPVRGDAEIEAAKLEARQRPVPGGRVPVVFMRGTRLIAGLAEVDHKIGIEATDWRRVAQDVFHAAVAGNDRKEAERLIAAARASRRYAAQELVYASVYLIPDDVGEHVEAERRRVTDELATQFGSEALASACNHELATRQRHRAAATCQARRLADEPNDGNARINHATESSLAGEYDAALESARYATERLADSITPYGMRIVYKAYGNALVGKGRIREGREAYARGASLDENDLNLRIQLALTYHLEGDDEGYVRAKSETLARYPGSEWYLTPHFLMIEVARAMERGSEEEARRLLARFPWDPTTGPNTICWPDIPGGRPVYDAFARLAGDRALWCAKKLYHP